MQKTCLSFLEHRGSYLQTKFIDEGHL